MVTNNTNTMCRKYDVRWWANQSNEQISSYFYMIVTHTTGLLRSVCHTAGLRSDVTQMVSWCQTVTQLVSWGQTVTQLVSWGQSVTQLSHEVSWSPEVSSIKGVSVAGLASGEGGLWWGQSAVWMVFIRASPGLVLNGSAVVLLSFLATSKCFSSCHAFGVFILLFLFVVDLYPCLSQQPSGHGRNFEEWTLHCQAASSQASPHEWAIELNMTVL